MMSSISGLWRDGELLVVELNGANFGGRCPWTNEVVSSIIQVPVCGPRPAGWHYNVLSGFGYGSKRALLTLPMPASEGWRARRDSAKRRFGYLIALLGLAAIVAGVAMYFILEKYNPSVFQQPHPNGFTWSVFLMIGGAFSIGAGLVWPKLEGAPGPGGYIQAELIDEPNVWIRGANSKFLEALPSWNGDPLGNRKKGGPSLADAWGAAWPWIVIMALVSIVVATLIVSVNG